MQRLGRQTKLLVDLKKKLCMPMNKAKGSFCTRHVAKNEFFCRLEISMESGTLQFLSRLFHLFIKQLFGWFEWNSRTMRIVSWRKNVTLFWWSRINEIMNLISVMVSCEMRWKIPNLLLTYICEQSSGLKKALRE